jgi:Asp-tRNA(Asn)/Glu-tRNA(Gln) amidotransferase A subunit family amidase
MYKKLIILLLIILLFPLKINATTKAVIDITNTNIYEIQNMINKGYLDYETLVNLYLERIEKYNKQYNAIISVNDEAISIAKERDKKYKEKGKSSLLYGIPIILKDNIDYDGLPTTVGTKALKDSIPYDNAKIVENLVNAGAIIIGKANMSEFAFQAENSRSSYGHVYNAFNIKYTPYGSSGGSAVSVAASLSALALGTDTNASVRLPSSANNIVGLRPTYNLLSLDGIVAYDITRDAVGPMSKTVSENALLLTTLANNGIDYTKYLNKDGLSGKNIGVVTGFIKKKSSSVNILNSYYKDVETLTNDAIEVMKKAGANIIYLDEFYTSYYNDLNNKSVFGITMCYQFNQYIKGTSSTIKSFQDLLNKGGYIQPLSGYNKNCYTDISGSTKVKGYKTEFTKYVDETMDKYNLDAMIYPNAKAKTLTIEESVSKGVTSTGYTIAPMTGMPAISVPIGFDSSNLPYGLEIIARKNREDIIYEIAYSYEQKTKFNKNPDIAPNLYDIPENLGKLIKYNEETKLNKTLYTQKSYEEYEKSYKNISTYLRDYNNKNEGEISVLISGYETSKSELKHRIPELIFYISGFILFLILLRIRVVIRRNRKRKRMYKNH